MKDTRTKQMPAAKEPTGNSLAKPEKPSLAPLVAAGLLLIAFVSLFLGFFPNRAGHLGHDYAYIFPALLDGFFWFRENGLGEIPWFTPSFCGGSLVYPNVVRGFYTLPQFLTFIVNPLTAVRLNLVIFALIGLWGTYLLSRRAFKLSWQVSLYASGFFLFNGFFSHRMLVGHIAFCHFMLLPLIACLLLRPHPEPSEKRRPAAITETVLSGLLLAAIVHSNYISLILPTMIAILIIGLIHCLLHGQTMLFLLRLGGTCIMGVLFSLSRLCAAVYMLETFPRSAYNLPGAKGFLDAAVLILRNLSISPVYDGFRFDTLANPGVFLDRHEWEYSVTPIPLVIIAIGMFVLARRRAQNADRLHLDHTQWALTAAIGLLLLVPVALNSYYPAWNQFIKQLPVICNSSSLIRWTLIYIPVVILASALILEKACRHTRTRFSLVFLSLAALIAANVMTDRGFYQAQTYNPIPVLQSYDRVKKGLWTPEIQQVLVCIDDRGRTHTPPFRNDAITLGGSQQFCYEPVFGYWLESFPFGKLHPGPVMEPQDGILNIKNPACLIWPGENNCNRGDHFTTESQANAAAFARYKPFPFNMPIIQKIANWLNGFALIAAALFLVAGSFRRFRSSA